MLRQWVGQLVALVVVAGALELLLPEGRMRGYVRMVTGLLVVLALLRPALALMTRQQVPDLSALATAGEGRLPSLAEVNARAARLRTGNNSLVREQFRRRLEGAAAELARAVPGVAAAEARAEVAAGPPGGTPAVVAVTIRVRPDAGGRAEAPPPAGAPVRPVVPIRPVDPIRPLRPPEAAPGTGPAADGTTPGPAAADAPAAAAPGPEDPLAAAVQAAVADGLGIAPDRVQVTLDPAE